MSRPKPVRVLDDPTVALTIIGCGGTGGYLLQLVCRLLYGLKTERLAAWNGPAMFGEAPPEGVPEVLLVDGDAVEEKNLLRQYFLPGDVGKNKARVLAERYGAAYGLRIGAYPNYLTEGTDLSSLVPEGSVVVGCVDNSKTRKILHEKLNAYEDVVYVDAGNAAVEEPLGDPQTGLPDRHALALARESGWAGQVLCGVRKDGENVVPFPGEQMPDLIEGDDRLPTEQACGDVVVSNPQRQSTNVWAANVLMAYVNPLLSDGTILHSASYFDARRCFVRSDAAVDALDEVAV